MVEINAVRKKSHACVVDIKERTRVSVIKRRQNLNLLLYIEYSRAFNSEFYDPPFKILAHNLE